MTCPDMQLYSRSMTKAELESNILEMTAFYGEYKDIFDKLLIASTSNEVIFDKYFFDIWHDVYEYVHKHVQKKRLQDY